MKPQVTDLRLLSFSARTTSRLEVIKNRAIESCCRTFTTT
jgi:hypothetical protein